MPSHMRENKMKQSKNLWGNWLYTPGAVLSSMHRFLWFWSNYLKGHDKNVCVVITTINRGKWHNQLVMSAMGIDLRGTDTNEMLAGLQPTDPTFPGFQREKYRVFLSISFIWSLLKIPLSSWEFHTPWLFSTTNKDQHKHTFFSGFDRWPIHALLPLIIYSFASASCIEFFQHLIHCYTKHKQHPQNWSRFGVLCKPHSYQFYQLNKA